jgi:hypothetical protein
MPSPKITVATPTIRLQGAKFVYASLCKQVFRDFEWLIATSADLVDIMQETFPSAIVYPDPPKRELDITNVYKSNNMLATLANGELVVACVDYTDLSANALSALWYYYRQDRKSVYSIFGDFYSNYESILPNTYEFTDFKFTNICCPHGSISHVIHPMKFDFAVASSSKQSYYDVGGIDETYDKYTGNAEKDFVARLSHLGYSIMTEHCIHMKGYTAHGRLPEWKEELWPLSVAKLEYDLACVYAGTRLKLDYVR